MTATNTKWQSKNTIKKTMKNATKITTKMTINKYLIKYMSQKNSLLLFAYDIYQYTHATINLIPIYGRGFIFRYHCVCVCKCVDQFFVTLENKCEFHMHSRHKTAQKQNNTYVLFYVHTTVVYII